MSNLYVVEKDLDCPALAFQEELYSQVRGSLRESSLTRKVSLRPPIVHTTVDLDSEDKVWGYFAGTGKNIIIRSPFEDAARELAETDEAIADVLEEILSGTHWEIKSLFTDGNVPRAGYVLNTSGRRFEGVFEQLSKRHGYKIRRFIGFV